MTFKESNKTVRLLTEGMN